MADDMHDDSDGAGWPDKNMPADKPVKQPDWGAEAGGGTHDDGGEYGPTMKPATLKPSVGSGGMGEFKGNADGELVFGEAEPRRSHE